MSATASYYIYVFGLISFSPFLLHLLFIKSDDGIMPSKMLHENSKKDPFRATIAVLQDIARSTRIRSY